MKNLFRPRHTLKSVAERLRINLLNKMYAQEVKNFSIIHENINIGKNIFNENLKIDRKFDKTTRPLGIFSDNKLSKGPLL